MLLKFGTVQVFPKHTIIPLMKGNCMIVDHPCCIDFSLEIAISFVSIEFNLSVFMSAMIAYSSQSDFIMTKKTLTIRPSEREYNHLSKYCELTERSQNDVIRELIRSLSVSGGLNPLD